MRREAPSAAVFIVLVLCLASPVLAQENQAALDSASVPAATADASLPDAPSASQAAVESHSFGSELGRGVLVIGKDELTFIKAPFQKKNIKWDLLVVGVTAPLIATDEQVARQVNPAWHDNSLTVSNALTYANVAAAGGIFLTGLITDNDHAKDTGVATARGAADAFLLYGAMKVIFQRERPYTNNAEGQFFSGNWQSGSFPSGHSTLDWTIASVIAHEYPKWPVQLAMYSLATAVSTTRVTGGVHFPSDVVVGGMLGYLVGRYVAKQDNHWPGDHSVHSSNRFSRAEDAVLSHVAIGVQ